MIRRNSKLLLLAALRSDDLIQRIDSLKLLTDLPIDEALDIVEQILRSRGHMGLKLEALRYLSGVSLSVGHFKVAARIIDLSLHDIDQEVIRNGLLAIQELPAKLNSQSVRKELIVLLEHNDSDIIYHAIMCLLHLDDHALSAEAYNKLESLARNENAILSAKAIEALKQVGENR